MAYHLYIDECGDGNLNNFNPEFPVFTLCGVVIEINEYRKLVNDLQKLKLKFWNDTGIIIHSRDIRRCEKNFKILLDSSVKEAFYKSINSIIKETKYNIVSCSILKKEYIRKYGRLENIYSISLSFIMERVVFLLDEMKANSDKKDSRISVYVEKRGKNEDRELLRYYNYLLDKGTYYVNCTRIGSYFKEFNFKWKRENIAGLQLADLLAYPLSKYVLRPDQGNLNFEMIREKIYQKNNRLYGLKIFPAL
ncbi:MAG: DUF3800 domain-containing protein [Candidatus Kapaibacterium sp.]